jgi:hypothetical protein
VHTFPEKKQSNRIKAAIAIFIKAKTPNATLKPNFPYSSIVSELSIIVSAINDLISLKDPFNSPRIFLPSFKLSIINSELLSSI